MKVQNHRRFLGSLLVAALSLCGAAFPALAAPADGAAGHRVGGDFDLDQAILERQALVDRLTLEMPRGARESRILVPVSDAERDAITASTEARLRIGIVKELAPPVIFRGTDGLTARAEQGGRAAGVLEPTADGGYVWAATLESPGATALRLHLTDMDLAPGVEIYLHSERGEAFGPYTETGLLGTGEFWSHTIAGERVTVQLRQPGLGGASAPSTFTIREIGYVDLTRIPGMPKVDLQVGEQLCSFNANCVENANCNAIPAAIQNARDAYAHMEFVQGAFLFYCSGGLVATNPSSGTPYFLTANHCLSSNNVASSLQAFFQYDTSCGGACPGTLPFYNDTPPPFPRTVGATLKATSGTSDYTLLQLTQSAPAGSAFLGWTKTAVANSNGTALYRISHPGGAPQAYSTHVVDTSKPTCQGIPRGAWIYSEDTLGATEGGSSGSPVLNASGQIVGQLTGACGTDVNNQCNFQDNATIDGAFANYYCGVQPFLDPADTSCGGGGGCTPVGGSCTANSECCSNACKGKPGAKKCK